MATQFPLNPQVNDLYQGYYWDGNFWKKSGQDAGFGYLEEAALQATYERLIPYSSSAPANPLTGDIWIDSTNNIKPITKVYNGSTWIIASGQAEATIHQFFLAGI